MKNKLSNSSRLLLLISAIGLIIVLFTPIWRIELDAPQYPEGLSLTIHAKGLQGNVDIINGLNHYIGMKTLHNEDFFEFTILPYCIVFFALAFLLVAVLNKKKWLNILFAVFVLFGIVAMIDFWRWEYNYGHNLDPAAAIVVPGMAYQPPLIGFKQLLNFGAYSIPAIGGWIFISVGVLSLLCVITEWRKSRLIKNRFTTVNTVTALVTCMVLGSCNASPEPITIGKDNCYFCKMTITDIKYGAELLTKKGKIYKFDDVQCALDFLQTKVVESKEIKDIYLVDFMGNHSLMKATEGFLLKSDQIRSPMNGTIAAFKSRDSMKTMLAPLNATEISWNKLAK